MSHSRQATKPPVSWAVESISLRNKKIMSHPSIEIASYGRNMFMSHSPVYSNASVADDHM